MRPLSRVALLCVSALALSAVLVSLPATPLAPANTAAADNPSCIPGYFDVGNLTSPPHRETDPDVGTYVSGDLLISTAASEMEGTSVIGGNATFDSGAYFNVGTVGAGSQYVPAAGTDMLTVGGDLTIPSAFDVEVGNLTAPIGGNVVVGGSVSAADQLQLQLNGGTLTQGGGPGVIAPYAPVAAFYAGLSVEFSALADTGTVTVDADNVNFTSTNNDTRQVFTVAGDELGTLVQTKTINFIDMPVDAVIVINVTGTTAVLSANVFTLNGVSINPFSAEPDRAFSHLTQSIAWNFESATSVTLGRQDQLLGSVLVPTAGSSTTVYTSTNGRLYINGDLTLGGRSSESGLEIHNYPFRNCSVGAGTGSISVDKVLLDTDSVVDVDRAYTGTLSCTVGTPSPNTWSVTADGPPATFTGIPAGSVCTIAEDAPTAPPSSTDSSYLWEPARFLTSNVITVGSGTTATVQVQNEVRRGLGALEMIKVLDDPFDVVNLDRLYTGSFECRHLGVDVTPSPGTWQTTAGAAPLLLATGLPAGTQCTLTEDPLDAPPLAGFPQFIWDTTIISPAVVTISEGATSRITVTNIVYDPFDLPDAAAPELPRTGADLAWPLGLGGIALVVGLLLVLAARRHSTPVE